MVCLPVVVMVVVQMAFAGANIIYKLAMQDGMDPSIMVAYRYIFATAFTSPIAFILERSRRPDMTWKILAQAFLCGLLGASLAQNLYVGSISATSATYASALSNLIPVITFIMSIAFRFEKLNRSAPALTKLMGTLIGLGGAMLLTFYKGPEIHTPSTHFNLMPNSNSANVSHPMHQNILLGVFLGLACCISQSMWLMLQTHMMEFYPCPYTSTALMSFMASIQAVIYALCRDHNWEEWKLGWDVRLLSVTFSGFIISGICIALMTWCVQLRGPVFMSSFSPLMLVFTAIAALFLLDEKLHLGSILGGALIIIGVFAVQWGKSKEVEVERKKKEQVNEDVLTDNGDNNKKVVHALPHV